jgi:hypothetical protein
VQTVKAVDFGRPLACVAMEDAPPAPTKSCFVIAPIGQPASDTRKRSDKILKHVVRKAVEDFGYSVTRADEIDHSGQITSQVISRIMEDELVVADLTDLNPNVFYELALRHALRKPFIQIAEVGTDIPFDLQNQRTILVDHRDLDSAAEACHRIANAISDIESGSAVETPMSFALSLQDLRESAKPDEQGIAKVVDTVNRLEALLVRERSDGLSGVIRSDFVVLRSLVEKLSQEGRLISNDEADMIGSKTVSKAFRAWCGTLSFVKPASGSFTDEPPF